MKLVVEGDLIPALRRHSFTTLATKDCTQVLRDIAARAPNLATKGRQFLNGIVDYAIKEGLRDDGKVLALDGVIPTFEKNHIAAITRPDELGPLLRAIDGYGSPIVMTGDGVVPPRMRVPVTVTPCISVTCGLLLVTGFVAGVAAGRLFDCGPSPAGRITTVVALIC